MNNDKKRLDVVLMATSIVVIGIVVFFLRMYPEQTTSMADSLFAWTTKNLGLEIDIWTVAMMGLLLWVAFSKYGKIRLGEGKPEYSRFSWIVMIMCCGLGAATIWWGFVEWGYYYGASPQIWGYELSETMRYELALAYNQFHWGPTAWGIFIIFALPIAYHYYVRKRHGLSMAATFANVFDKENPDRITEGWAGKLIDIIFVFAVFGSVGITLGLGISMITKSLAAALGTEATFAWNLILVVVICVVYSASSYVGIEKGMRRISDSAGYIAIGFAACVALAGPTLHIFKSMFNSMGILFSNYLRMSTWMEPFESTGFVDSWTIFYWLYWMVFGPMLGVFITRVSKGRTIKEMILGVMVFGSLGLWYLHGIFSNFTMWQNITGAVNTAGLINGGDPDGAIVQTLCQLPVSTVFIFVFAICGILFLATTLDSASFTLSAVVTKGIKEGDEPSPILKLVWCICLSLVPLTMVLIGAPLNTFKTLAIVAGVPMVIVCTVMIYGWLKDMFEDYGSKTAEEMAEEFELEEPEAPTEEQKITA